MISRGKAAVWSFLVDRLCQTRQNWGGAGGVSGVSTLLSGPLALLPRGGRAHIDVESGTGNECGVSRF